MSKYLTILFAIMFVVLCFSCSGRTIREFEAPVAHDQQGVTNNSNLDQFVDDVKPYPDNNNADAQQDAFYNDNNSSSDTQK